ncbi:MAG: hypothetical protein M3Y35_16510 [Actinomycetota bacterium]|nr:hypothetical protein [Actinomycetota bacterium]
MRRTRRSSYGMAMVAGIAIVGASTGAVVGATHHHDQAVAAIAATAESVGVATSSSRIEQPSSVTPPASTLLDSTPSASAPLDSAPSDSAPSDSAQSEADPEATAPVGSAPGGPVPSAPSHSTPVTASGAAPGSRSGQKVAPTTAPTTAPTPSASTRKTTAATSSPTPAPAVAQKFKDGQYQATGSYNSPGGVEKLGVTVTLLQDKVTKSSLDLLGGDGLSHTFQSAFASGYSSQILGKKIDTISLGAISGSSLTSLGFNDALKQIQTKARA